MKQHLIFQNHTLSSLEQQVHFITKHIWYEGLVQVLACLGGSWRDLTGLDKP
jgi:hypothetical protein